MLSTNLLVLTKHGSLFRCAYLSVLSLSPLENIAVINQGGWLVEPQELYKIKLNFNQITNNETIRRTFRLKGNP